MSRSRANLDRAHQARRGFRGQLLLQLPHAVHDLRPAEDDPQPHDQQSVGRPRASRPGRPNACNLCHLDKTLAWTSRRARRGGTARRRCALSDDDTIDCGVAAVAASRRRRAARDRRGGDGVGPAHRRLGHRLDGAASGAAPRRSLRCRSFIASRSLRTLPGFRTFSTISSRRRTPAVRRSCAALATWDRHKPSPPRQDAKLLLDGKGNVDVAEVHAVVERA